MAAEYDIKEIITLTMGDCAENHVGNQQIGHKLPVGSGFTRADLEHIGAVFEERGGHAEHITLTTDEIDVPDASVLILRDAVSLLLGEDALVGMYQEQIALEWDQKVKMYGRVVNKHARHNLCYDVEAQEPDYEQGKGRIVALDDVPLLSQLMGSLRECIGEKAEHLKVEGNRYYDPSKTGIGFHGDTERVKVIAVRLGATESMPILYQWFQHGSPVGQLITIPLYAGDIYIMSEKAVGHDWKKKIVPTLRHATGCEKFTRIQPEKASAVKQMPPPVKKMPPVKKEKPVSYTVPQLRAMCKARGVKGYSALRKKELLDLLDLS